MRKQREANPNLDKEQYERKKNNDPDFKEKIRAKNARAYQMRKARLAAQKLEEEARGLQTLDKEGLRRLGFTLTAPFCIIQYCVSST